jgi:hypothetical protein
MPQPLVEQRRNDAGLSTREMVVQAADADACLASDLVSGDGHHTTLIHQCKCGGENPFPSIHR